MIEQADAPNPAMTSVFQIGSWGSPEIAAQTDWPYRIRKDLGETRKLKWRSEAEREKFEAAQKKKYAEWDIIIGTKPRA